MGVEEPWDFVAGVDAELVGELAKESLIELEVRVLVVVVEAASKLVWRLLAELELSPEEEEADSVAL